MAKTVKIKKEPSRWMIVAQRWFSLLIIAAMLFHFSSAEHRQQASQYLSQASEIAGPVVKPIMNRIWRACGLNPPLEQTAIKEKRKKRSAHREAPSQLSLAMLPPPPDNHMPSQSELFAIPLPSLPNTPAFFQPRTSHPLETRQGPGKPVQFAKKALHRTSFYQAVIDLRDPDTFLAIGLANNATEANCAAFTHGDEAFASLVKRSNAALVLNGTFFSKDDQKRVMGNMVSAGRFLKYSQWENYGTTLGLKAGNEPEMVTARTEGKPQWDQYWFSITCGPRLLRDGEVCLNPTQEGFTDSHVLGIGPRVAMGFPRSKDKLYLVTFLSGLSLEQEAKLMQQMGCCEAMNLDGGASRALAHENATIISAGRPLTNVIAIYDSKHRAPAELISSWQEFQRGERPTVDGWVTTVSTHLF